MENKINKLEEGGVFGVFADTDTASTLYAGLYGLQHRGQASCGAVVSDNFELSIVKGKGLISEVIEPSLNKLKGDMGIAHVRYGDDSNADIFAQPLISNYLKGNISISIAGKITNSESLRADLEDIGAIFQLGSDAEILAHLFARERTKTDSIEGAVLRVMGLLEGAYAVLLMSSSKILAFRDSNGYRPLSIGKKGESFLFASEDVAFTSAGGKKLRDVLPGELVLAAALGEAKEASLGDGVKATCEISTSKGEITSYKNHCETAAKTCIYEYLYFARPDSELDGVSVYLARVNAGRRLFTTCPASADIVVGVPSAGIHYAMGYAAESGIPFGDALIRNYYLGRISSRDDLFKQRAVNIKLNVIKASISDRRVVLVDDSIIQGTTAKRIVSMLREAGAKEIHLRIACPRFDAVCPFSEGINSKLKSKSVEDIRKEIGADSLMFLPKEELNNIGIGLDNCKKCF